MSLEFTVEGADGVNTVGANDLAQAFQSQGYSGAQLSQDGQTMTVTDPSGGSAEINIPEYLASKGKVTGIRPAEGMVDYGAVDNGARRGIAALGNHEDLKKLYLKAHLRDQGVGDLNVVGSGDDFYFFDPKSGRYHALTNKPGMDLTDVNEFGVDALENTLGIGGSILGGIGGGAAGSAAGPVGTVIGGAAGSAAGGGLGRGAFDAGAMALDPRLRELMGSEEFQTSRLQQAGFDALGGGVAGVVGAVAPKLLQRGLVSGATKATGGALDATGGAVASVAKYANSDAMIPKVARGIAENFVPVTGQAQLPALLARAGELVPMGLKATNKAANKLYSKGVDDAARAEGVLPGFAGSEETAFQKLMDKTATYTAEKGLTLAPEATWAEKLAARLGGKKNPGAGVAKEAGVRDSIRNLSAGTRFEGTGNALAEVAQHASTAGRAVDAVNSGVVKGAIGTVGAAGKGTQVVGRGLKAAGTVAAPIENRLLIRQGLPWGSEESQDLWQKMTRKPKSLGERLGYN